VIPTSTLLGLSNHYQMSLDTYKNILSEASLNSVTDLKDSIFINLIKCAFIRNVEFNEILSKSHSNEFYFLLPFLRGLAEDIISLNYHCCPVNIVRTWLEPLSHKANRTFEAWET